MRESSKGNQQPRHGLTGLGRQSPYEDQSLTLLTRGGKGRKGSKQGGDIAILTCHEGGPTMERTRGEKETTTMARTEEGQDIGVLTRHRGEGGKSSQSSQQGGDIGILTSQEGETTIGIRRERGGKSSPQGSDISHEGQTTIERRGGRGKSSKSSQQGGDTSIPLHFLLPLRHRHQCHHQPSRGSEIDQQSKEGDEHLTHQGQL